MNQEKIGKFICSLRKGKKLTQDELARRIGVTDKAISKWENGRCMPDISIMDNLCKELNITINDLLSGEVVSEDEYTQKLESNIINTLKENNILLQKRNKKYKFILIGVLIGFLMALMSIFFIVNRLHFLDDKDKYNEIYNEYVNDKNIRDYSYLLKERYSENGIYGFLIESILNYGLLYDEPIENILKNMISNRENNIIEDGSKDYNEYVSEAKNILESKAYEKYYSYIQDEYCNYLDVLYKIVEIGSFILIIIYNINFVFTYKYQNKKEYIKHIMKLVLINGLLWLNFIFIQDIFIVFLEGVGNVWYSDGTGIPILIGVNDINWFQALGNDFKYIFASWGVIVLIATILLNIALNIEVFINKFKKLLNKKTSL